MAENYIEIIKIALIIFPFVALTISAPFILIEYHKYGSISFYKGLFIYSLTLYFMCAYFLVILPLPNRSEVALMTTPTTQFIPFNFIIDYIKNTSFDIANTSTYIKAIKESYFLVPIFNILLTIPFGMYLRYYFNCNLKKTLLFTFLLSLFFELTQLSGLYFIYERSYRLFDVDDLILNTLGGLIGYYAISPLIKKLPSLSKIEKSARERGKKVSGLKRTTSFLLDIFIIGVIESFLLIIVKNNTTTFHIIVALIYYIVIPILLKSKTLGQKFLNIKVVDYNNNENIIKLIFRKVLFIIVYIGIPFLIITITSVIKNTMIESIIKFPLLFILPIVYIITIFKYLFTNKPMIYEKISKTMLVSTIK